MKSAITFIFGLCMSIIGFAQEQEIHISDDIGVFLYMYYGKGQTAPANDGIKIADYVAEGINNKIPEKYRFCLDLEICIYEKENNCFIGYERIEYLLNYFERKYEIDRERFLFIFYDSNFCYIEREDNISSIRFVLKNCKVSQEPNIEVSEDIFETVFYDSNQILPTDKGKRTIDTIATAIKNNKISKEYNFLWQIALCNKEKENNPFIGYERIEHLLHYLEKEYEIERDKFQFEFLGSELSDSEQENQKSFIKFTILSCE